MASKKLVEVDPIKFFLAKQRRLEQRVSAAEDRPPQEVIERAGELSELTEDVKRVLLHVKGVQGERGEAGIPGIQGDIGPRGPQGEEGLTGLDGRDGVDGRNGKDGARGERGLQGPAGKDGAHGRDGRDITAGTTKPASPKEQDLFLEAPNGDLWQYLNGKWKKIGNLKGIAGATGAQGQPGPPGAPGYTVYAAELLDNTASQVLASFDKSLIGAVFIEYQFKEAGQLKLKMGRYSIVCDGVSGITKNDVESNTIGNPGVTLNAAIVGSNIVFLASTTGTGNARTGNFYVRTLAKL